MAHYKSLCDLPEPAHKDDAGKPRFGLIPPKAERSVAEVLTFGAEKYDAEAWRRLEDGERRFLDAALRHINAFRDGEKLDQESKNHHLAHAISCLLFVLELDFNDEP